MDASNTDSKSTQSDTQDLLELLIEQKLISKAQADLAVVDRDMTGMTIADVLIARRWVDRDTLLELAPWLKQELLGDPSRAQETKAGSDSSGESQSSKSDYQSNLKKYRELMTKILGQYE